MSLAEGARIVAGDEARFVLEGETLTVADPGVGELLIMGDPDRPVVVTAGKVVIEPGAVPEASGLSAEPDGKLVGDD